MRSFSRRAACSMACFSCPACSASATWISGPISSFASSGPANSASTAWRAVRTSAFNCALTSGEKPFRKVDLRDSNSLRMRSACLGVKPSLAIPWSMMALKRALGTCKIRLAVAANSAWSNALSWSYLRINSGCKPKNMSLLRGSCA